MYVYLISSLLRMAILRILISKSAEINVLDEKGFGWKGLDLNDLERFWIPKRFDWKGNCFGI